MRLLAALLAGCIMSTAMAAPDDAANPEFIICTLETGLGRITTPDGQGLAQQSIRDAASEVPLRLKWITAPRRRCVAEAEAGRVHAILATHHPRYLAFLAYPGGNERPDAAHAAALLRVRVYRPKGSAANWDGKRFQQLGRLAVGVQSGFVYRDQLAHLGVPVDDGAPSLPQQFSKLLNGRLALVLAIEGDAAQLLHGTLGERIEMLPHPFVDDPLYLAVNKAFYSRHRAAIDRIWQRLTPHQ